MTYKNYTAIIRRSLLPILFVGVSTVFGTPLDSLRTEQIDGKLFIIHQVDQGETLYALSRRYKTSIPNIISHNPSAKMDLKVGAMMKIPLSAPSAIDGSEMISHQVKSKETLFSIAHLYEVKVGDIKSWNNLTTNELSIGQNIYVKSSVKPVISITKIDSNIYATHQLQKGETLYSLSKKYKTSVDQLRSWNNLQDNTLSIRQLLIVGKKAIPTLNEVYNTKIGRDSISVDSTTNVVPTEVGSQTDITQTSDRVKNIHGYEEIIETGIGELIPGSTETRKYLGFHRTAKIGTIMKVRNEMNNIMVYVRIIGRIPNTGDNKKVLLKISKAAYDRLGVIDPRFRVEVSYMP